MSEATDYSAALGITVNVPVVALGPAESKRVQDQCTAVLSGVAKHFEGRVLDASGGNLSIVFESASQAIQAARTMSKRIGELAPVADRKITIGIGASTTLGKAMALMLGATEGQIVTDDDFNAALDPQTIAPDSVPGYVPGQGSAETDAPTPTSVPEPAPAANLAPRTRLTLTYQGKTVVVDDNNREAKIGRGPECALQINDPWASRVHATVLRQGNRFVLLDSSTNGTFYALPEGMQVKLHKRPLTLDRSGSFSLGRIAAQALGGPIFYTLE